MKQTLTAILLCALLVLSCAGCGSEQTPDTPDGQESEARYYLYLSSYEEAGGLISVLETDESGTSATQYYGGIGVFVKEGETVAQALAGSNFTDMNPVADGDSFEGWLEYTETLPTEENGLERTFYELVPGQKLYSNQELLDMTLDHDANFVAKWATFPADQYFVLDNTGGDWPSDTLAFAFSANGGTMTFMEAEGAQYDATSYTYWLDEGEALNDIMGTAFGAALLDIRKEGAEFAGWTVYAADSVSWSEEPVEEEGFTCMVYDEYSEEQFTYLLLENASCIRECSPTEELCGMTLEGQSFFAVANWN